LIELEQEQFDINNYNAITYTTMKISKLSLWNQL